MERVEIDGITLEYEESGSGEPVLFIHGALMADTYRPLLNQPALKGYRFIGYCRRGYAGSSPPNGALSVSDHAADALALLQKLDAAPAHLVGHSSGGAIALQLALDAPKAVRSLTLLEPALLDVPSGGALFEKLGAAGPVYEAGDKAGAVDTFLSGVCGQHYRDVVDARLPGTLDQAAADADAFFTGELPAVGGWAFTQADAARISQPVLSVMGVETQSAVGLPVYTEVHERVLDWFPNARPFVLPNAAHLLQVENPQGMAEALSQFLAEN
ncbi:MAG TPA: alpha/beta hydrolase [Dehalococcoidia bacterium]|nr:alpha/beta hydrolase [Dehalococcoidia bacterium]